MSSYDSLDIVFRCLSKGAADYLVKPVRKNELRNLWQHVWRKCHSVSARFGLVACLRIGSGWVRRRGACGRQVCGRVLEGFVCDGECECVDGLHVVS
jgi:FixJ family two-component response regulator